MLNYIAAPNVIYRIYLRVRSINLMSLIKIWIGIFRIILMVPSRRITTRLLQSIELNQELSKCNPKNTYRNPHSVN